MSAEELADTKNNLAQELSEELAQKQQNDSVNEVTYEVDETASNTTSQPEEKMQDSNTTSTTESYPFIGVTYKHEHFNLTFQLKTPDADGNPTEVVFNGEAYDEMSFDNETFTLSDISVTNDSNGYMVQGKLPIGEKTYEFYIATSGDDSWKMFGPGFGQGEFYQQ